MSLTLLLLLVLGDAAPPNIRGKAPQFPRVGINIQFEDLSGKLEMAVEELEIGSIACLENGMDDSIEEENEDIEHF